MADDTAELQKSIEELTKEIKNLGGDTGTFGKLQKQSNVASETIKKFGTSILKGSTSLTDYSQTFSEAVASLGPGFAKVAVVFNVLVQVVDRQVEMFRELSQVGADFGDSIFDVRYAAAQAGVSLETYSRTVMQNSQMLALFGGNATVGARRLSQISGRIQNQFGPALSRMGFTMEETTEGLANYLSIQTELGRAQNMSNEELVYGTASYLQELDLLSRITGQNRKQLQEQMQQQMADARVKAMMAGMDEKTRQTVASVMSMMGDAPPELKQAVTEMIATGGTPFSKAGKMIAMTSPQLATALGQLKTGGSNLGDVMGAFRQSARDAAALGPMFDSLAIAGYASGDASIAAGAHLMKYTNLGEKDFEARQDQQRAMASGGKAIADFNRAMQQVVNLIAVILTPVISAFAEGIGYVVQFVGMLQKGLERLIGEGGIKTLVTALTVLVGTIIGLRVATLAYHATLKGISAVKGGVSAAGGVGSYLMSGAKSMIGLGPKAAPAAPAAPVGKGGAAAEFLNKASPQSGGMLQSLAAGFSAFANPKVLIGAAGLGAAIGIVIGIAGGAIAGVLALMGAALEKFGKGLDAVAAVGGDRLRDVAGAIGELGENIYGNKFAMLTSGFKAADLVAWAAGMNLALNTLDKGKIDSYSSSLNSLADALNGVKSGVTGAVQAGSQSSNETMSKLNITMEEILDVLKSSNRYAKRTSDTIEMNT